MLLCVFFYACFTFPPQPRVQSRCSAPRFQFVMSPFFRLLNSSFFINIIFLHRIVPEADGSCCATLAPHLPPTSLRDMHERPTIY